ncbi:MULTISPECIES: CDGSH iron-sulfur domain-containing protein [Legionella]|uniref:CDGSH iron-sulfur domain-containing protein n=1 Tax=Legionella septentrionalis TaxID=2498109 RepID=A0A3S0VAY1_9GAMM|nr:MULTISPECIES: CDGSH iron-sulfur domain-containing protein [Legionella]MCP0914331.1 CDGSH iron-sulfur domain-containing protein [Legionella sp. 27cVA30]RUQ89007.1 CDGSH iron-sulfur domain-containing protein [Legionella septentrionalis]RUR00314.1 CDGSH iron-sulfur domain-containing protein [Legionella septentrionalis]RUR11829.1 CDGSH iron-sulfur domain-containing protein [Legionella septentrionalis]RUR17516.1 CDGSH iron-sulfur domain-containing protein [Legionella septentrionalis]
MTDKEMYKKFLPIAYEVEQGKIYAWCGCGKSETQPLCDYDREECKQQQVIYHAIVTETVFFCGCKQTQEPPLCDGSHAAALLECIKQQT